MKIYEVNPGQKKQFVPSNTKEEFTYTTFLNNCSESIAAMKQAGSFLYRGLTADYDIFLGKPRNNRKAMDSDKDVQKEVDKLFIMSGFTALRSNSIFCSGRLGVAKSYGHAFIIFPINGFTFTWSPKITDLYSHELNRVTEPSDLYFDTEHFSDMTNIAEIAAQEMTDHSEALTGPVRDPINKLITCLERFVYEVNGEGMVKDYTLAVKLTKDIEQKYRLDMRVAYNALGQIKQLLEKSTRTPQQVIKDWGYIDTDFASAISSEREVIVNGEYYAFNYNKYQQSLMDALLG